MLCIPVVEREHGLKPGVAQNCAIVSGSAPTRCGGHFTPSHPRTPRQGQGRRERVPDMRLEGLGSLSLNTPVIIG